MLLTSVSILCVCVCAQNWVFLPSPCSQLLFAPHSKKLQMRLKRSCKPSLQTCLPTRIFKGFFFPMRENLKGSILFFSNEEEGEWFFPRMQDAVWCFWMSGLRSTKVICSLWSTLLKKQKNNLANNASIPKIKEERPCSSHTSTTAKKESSHSL